MLRVLHTVVRQIGRFHNSKHLRYRNLIRRAQKLKASPHPLDAADKPLSEIPSSSETAEVVILSGALSATRDKKRSA